ncbi:hypothetical protein SAMN05421837_102499 [Amycolatopsis pretoriensis]|uniref:Uncharacterized protein n=1 Tax=Amycolatopsis pretoriensis TaxID=218821 RepID=A0A1H5QCX2_9PSEU|nr:hypothetical protein [Amycolatopsis pretoriensis]SEF23963.1 hypothetical protein SAMN05421837_102499 [Amycolatopsis pretoriensis]
MTLRFLITTVAQTARTTRPADVMNDSFMSSDAMNESFMTSGRATAPHPDTPEGAPR